jgi:hypothetical protein
MGYGQEYIGFYDIKHSKMIPVKYIIVEIGNKGLDYYKKELVKGKWIKTAFDKDSYDGSIYDLYANK